LTRKKLRGDMTVYIDRIIYARGYKKEDITSERVNNEK